MAHLFVILLCLKFPVFQLHGERHNNNSVSAPLYAVFVSLASELVYKLDHVFCNSVFSWMDQSIVDLKHLPL